MDDWAKDSSDEEDEERDEEDSSPKPAKKGKKKKEKETADDEGREESDEGDFDDREVDYMTDSSGYFIIITVILFINFLLNHAVLFLIFVAWGMGKKRNSTTY